MANLMEEKILEIVKRNFEIRDGLINQAQKDTADEIADNFRKFIWWYTMKKIQLSDHENHSIKGWKDYSDKTLMTFDELFDYWWNNIKDK